LIADKNNRYSKHINKNRRFFPKRTFKLYIMDKCSLFLRLTWKGGKKNGIDGDMERNRCAVRRESDKDSITIYKALCFL